SVNDETVGDFNDLHVGVVLSAPDTPLDVTVVRDQADGEQTLTYRMTPQPGGPLGLLSIGVAPPISLTIDYRDPSDRPRDLAAAGIQRGEQIVAVDGQPVERYDQFVEALASARGRAVPVTFRNPENGATTEVPLRATPVLPRAEGHRGEPPHIAGLVIATEVERVQAEKPAEKMGLRPGDLIASINGHPWPSVGEVSSLITESKSVTMEVLRDGKTRTLGPVTPVEEKDPAAPGKTKKILGFGPGLPQPLIARTLPDQPAGTISVPGGSRILAVNDQPVEHTADVTRLIQDAIAADQPVHLLIRRHEIDQPRETVTLNLTPEARNQLAQIEYQPPPLPLAMVQVLIQAKNPFEAAMIGIEKTHQTMTQIYLTVARLVQGTLPIKTMRGPVGITE
ncbi:MAG: site-2 protease family protein, partial [Phycisphaeraceae bacterium]|nr:site-2 protease family protein [Phycisphaeraceae bacterium]